MRLKDINIKGARPKAKPYRLFDGGGLYLEIAPSGGKYWRFKYRFAGRERRLALGTYPELTLADAREKHLDARRRLKEGHDPGELKKEAKRQAVLNADNTFENIAREWHGQHVHEWSPHYATDVINRLQKHIFPKLSGRPINNITATELLDVLRVIEKSGALDMAQRMLQTVGQVFAYALTVGKVERNPASDLRGALKTPVRTHNPYLTAADLPEYLQKLENYDGGQQTRLALKLLLLTFVRTSELRGGLWQEIDFDNAEWRIPAERMKMKDPHVVPLSEQAIAVLQELKKMNKHREFIFPNHRHSSRCMSQNTMIIALYRMDYLGRTTAHGFRASASTILNESGLFAPDVIERQLAHCERNKVRAAYNHAQYLPERRKMMQWWADELDKLAKKKPQGSEIPT